VFSEPARLASRSLLIDIAMAGERLVAVGDLGHVLLSDDKGRTWVQADSVPTRALLTGVCFADARRGIAVGHDEAILVTQDAGRTWKRTHYAPEAQQPLLGVWCGQAGRAIAVGAYSAYLTSEDGGASWTQHKLEVQSVQTSGTGGTSVSSGPAASGGAQVSRGAASADGSGVGGYHLNRIVAASSSRFYIAAEAGHLYRSDDGGAAWIELPSPYEGSFFGVLPLEGDALLAFGLRGNLFRSEDAGRTWHRIQTGTGAMLDDAVKLKHGGVAIVGLSGVVLMSRDGGKSFALMQQDDRKGLSAVLAVDADTLVAAGEDGIKLIHVNSPAAGRVPATGPEGATRELR
jgi:photosystem II stability/assembly factor-like uncharacterized protein